MFNTYGEDINKLMSIITSKVDYDSLPANSPVEVTMKYREDNFLIPLRLLLDRIEGQLKELNKMPYARLNSNRYEYSTLLYNLNTSMLWVYSGHEYKTFRQYCKAELSMSYEAVTMYLKTGKYMLMHDKPLNIFGNQDYSISKLYTLSVIPLNELRALAISNTITPDMTARDIQAFVREYTRRAKTANIT